MWRAPPMDALVAVDRSAQAADTSMRRIPHLSMIIPQQYLEWLGGSRGFLLLAEPDPHELEMFRLRTDSRGLAMAAQFIPAGMVAAGLPLPGFDAAERVLLRVVALRIVTRSTTEEPNDEVEVLRMLQAPGFDQLGTGRFLEWDWMQDDYNVYITTDTGPSVSAYADNWIRLRTEEFRQQMIQRVRVSQPSELESAVTSMVARVWMKEVLRIFHCVLERLAFMHNRGVCHLDINVNNVVMSQQFQPFLVRFHKAKAMINGRAELAAIELVDPVYAAPELRQLPQNRGQTARSILGAPADMWAAGVLLYQLLRSPYRINTRVDDASGLWLANLFAHVNHAGNPPCSKLQLVPGPCLICRFKICLPPLLYQVFYGLLQDIPARRLSARAASDLLGPPVDNLELRLLGSLETPIDPGLPSIDEFMQL